MNCKIRSTESFDKEVRRLAKRYVSLKKDLTAFVLELEENRSKGINLGGGVRKIRMKISAKRKGKSAGARFITFTVILSEQETILNLLFIYDKSERSTITLKEIDDLLRKNSFK